MKAESERKTMQATALFTASQMRLVRDAASRTDEAMAEFLRRAALERAFTILTTPGT